MTSYLLIMQIFHHHSLSLSFLDFLLLKGAQIRNYQGCQQLTYWMIQMAASPKMLHIWWTDLSQLKGWEYNGLMLNFRSFAPNYLWILAWDLQFTERTFLAKVFFFDLCQVEWAGREQQATTNPSRITRIPNANKAQIKANVLWIMKVPCISISLEQKIKQPA